MSECVSESRKPARAGFFFPCVGFWLGTTRETCDESRRQAVAARRGEVAFHTCTSLLARVCKYASSPIPSTLWVTRRPLPVKASRSVILGHQLPVGVDRVNTNVAADLRRKREDRLVRGERALFLCVKITQRDVLSLLALALANFIPSQPPSLFFVPVHVIETRRRQPSGGARRVMTRSSGVLNLTGVRSHISPNFQG